MKTLSIIALGLLIIGCAKTSDSLIVKTQTIRDQKMERSENSMALHEKARRLHGAVSMEERRQRLGQYYTVLWELEGGGNREVLFEYLQGQSGSKVKTMRRALETDATSGKEEFSVIGDNYFNNGRVLAWKISLVADGKIISSKQSYLWE